MNGKIVLLLAIVAIAFAASASKVESTVAAAIKKADAKADAKGVTKEEKKQMEKDAAQKAYDKIEAEEEEGVKAKSKKVAKKADKIKAEKKAEKAEKKSEKKYSKKSKKSGKKTENKYVWLNKIIKEIEKKLAKQEKRHKIAAANHRFARNQRMMNRRIRNDPFLQNLRMRPQPQQNVNNGYFNQLKNTVGLNNNNANNYNNNAYPIYKEDLSWSGYFWSYFGYPTRVQLDPNNELTQYMLQSGNKNTAIVTDSTTGVTYLQVTDGAMTMAVSVILGLIAIVAVLF